MTVKQLVDAFKNLDLDHDDEVYLAVDEEGNGYRPVFAVGVLFHSHGEFYNEDGKPNDAKRCIGLWPD